MRRLAVCLGLLLAACTPLYTAPSGDDPKVAYISDSSKDSENGSLSSRVVTIDGLQTTVLGIANKDLPIYEGVHQLLISTSYKPSIWGTEYISGVSVQAKLKAGRRYRVRTSIDKLYVKNWVTDMETDEVVSSVGSGIAKDLSTKVFVTYIPARR